MACFARGAMRAHTLRSRHVEWPTTRLAQNAADRGRRTGGAMLGIAAIGPSERGLNAKTDDAKPSMRNRQGEHLVREIRALLSKTHSYRGWNQK